MFEAEELTYEMNGERHSYNPTKWLINYTISDPYLKITTTLYKETKPTVQDVHGSLMASGETLLTSSVALMGNLNEFQWTYLYNYLTDIVIGDTYLAGSSSRVSLDGVDYIVVFHQPMTIKEDTDYVRASKRSHLQLIGRPTSGSDTGLNK